MPLPAEKSAPPETPPAFFAVKPAKNDAYTT
jgi:hypothetical protein